MRRSIPVVAVTIGGLALVANFHTSPGGVPLAAGPGSTKAPETSTSAERGSDTSITDGRPAPTHGSIRSAPTTTGVSTRPTTPPPTTAAAASAASVDGPVITTSYGDVQVRVSLSGKRLVDVQALRLPKDRSRSVRISANAGPKLRSEALQAQSANINLVSGASYTSQGYIDSLQGALDKAASLTP